MKKNKKEHRLKYKSQEMITGYMLIFPAVFMWVLWFLYPALKSMKLSFYDYSFIKPEQQKFIGLTNYIELLRDKTFFQALKHTFILAFVVVGFITILSFLVALLINGKIKGKTFFRTVYFMPYIISPIAVSIFFMYFFIKNGPGTKLFTLLGFQNTTWFTSKEYALFLVAIIYIWQQIGFYMILYIAGLQNIPIEIYEAAKIDGGNAWQITSRITIPLVKTTTYLVVTLGIINSFQIFDQIAAISKQSPLGSPAGATSTIVTFLYQQTFSYMNMGYGSAAAMVLVGIVFCISLLRTVISKDGNM